MSLPLDLWWFRRNRSVWKLRIYKRVSIMDMLGNRELPHYQGPHRGRPVTPRSQFQNRCNPIVLIPNTVKSRINPNLHGWKIEHALKTPHVVFLPVVFLSFSFGRLSEINGMSQCTFLTSWPWPMTLNYGLDLDILPLDFHTKIQVCMSVRSAAIARQTQTETDTRCQNYYTHHVRDMGCMEKSVSRYVCYSK